jgi:hypothetical protein
MRCDHRGGSLGTTLEQLVNEHIFGRLPVKAGDQTQGVFGRDAVIGLLRTRSE